MYEFNINILRKKLQDKGLTEAELTRRIGVTRACINRIMRRQRRPSEKDIVALISVFPDFPVQNFFTPTVIKR